MLESIMNELDATESMAEAMMNHDALPQTITVGSTTIVISQNPAWAPEAEFESRYHVTQSGPWSDARLSEFDSLSEARSEADLWAHWAREDAMDSWRTVDTSTD
jgi:hypothetical protein